jgi:FkbM family methyltransferase
LAAKGLGFGPYRWVHQVHPNSLKNWGDSLGEIEWIYDRLDDVSRKALVDIVAYRLMGERAVRLSINTDDYWTRLQEIESLKQGNESKPFGFQDWKLEKFNLSSIGYPIELFSRPSNIMAQFALEQYACDRLGVRVEEGFTVIDGGGCFGDTAVYFAHLAGSNGKVFSFEFVASNLKHYRQNVSLNPEIESRIKVCKHPLWSTSGMELHVQDRGPASTVTPGKPDGVETIVVETLSIDDLVKRESLGRIDFIKMDIEGAEFESLKGAEHAIKKFKPQLAICVYHSPQDFVRLAKLIHEFEPRYRFAMSHFTIHAEETVLFAKVEE